MCREIARPRLQGLEIRLRQILVISPDKNLLRAMRWNLQDAGFHVVSSSSLEDSFLAGPSAAPFLVIVDAEAASGELWLAADFLGWFHRRCPVFLLANEPLVELEGQCDRRFPRGVPREELIASIRELG